MLNYVTIVGNVRRFKRKNENGVLYKQLVMNALSKMKIREVVSPLGNEFVLDDKWLLEMDRDGAFAVIVSPVDRLDGDYSHHTNWFAFHIGLKRILKQCRSIFMKRFRRQ